MTLHQYILATQNTTPDAFRFAEKIGRALFALSLKRKKASIRVAGRVRYPHQTHPFVEEIIDIYLYPSKEQKLENYEMVRGASIGKPRQTLSVGELLAVRWLKQQL